MACDLNFADSSSVTWSTTTDAAGNISYVATSVGGSSQTFRYVPCDENIHIAGSIAGDGSTANPIQIPVTPKHAVRLEDIDPAAGTGGDDTAALLGAIDKSLAERTRVQLDGKTYNFDQPIVVDVDRETAFIEGCGGESKRFNDPPYSDGSVLNSRITSGDAFTFKGVQTQIRDMTIAGVTSGYVLATELQQMTVVKNIHLDAVGDATNGIRTDTSFTNIYENIDIYKRPRNMTGIGFWHNTTAPIAGGNMLMNNVTASYFRNNMELGQEAPYAGNARRNNTFINIQGRFGETGIRFGSGYLHAEVINPWAEHNTYAQMQVHSGAGPIWIRGGEFGGTTGHGLVLGLDPALGNNVPICPVTVQGATIRVWSGGFAGVRVFPPATIEPDVWHEFDTVEMWNNGGARFLTDPVAQMPLLQRRPKYVDPGGFWGPGSLIRVPNGPTGYVNYPTTVPNPMSVQTTPVTQV